MLLVVVHRVGDSPDSDVMIGKTTISNSIAFVIR